MQWLVVDKLGCANSPQAHQLTLRRVMSQLKPRRISLLYAYDQRNAFSAGCSTMLHLSRSTVGGDVGWQRGDRADEAQVRTYRYGRPIRLPAASGIFAPICLHSIFIVAVQFGPTGPDLLTILD
jgi:hypothetical protein